MSCTPFKSDSTQTQQDACDLQTLARLKQKPRCRNRISTISKYNHSSHPQCPLHNLNSLPLELYLLDNLPIPSQHNIHKDHTRPAHLDALLHLELIPLAPPTSQQSQISRKRRTRRPRRRILKIDRHHTLPDPDDPISLVGLNVIEHTAEQPGRPALIEVVRRGNVVFRDNDISKQFRLSRQIDEREIHASYNSCDRHRRARQRLRGRRRKIRLTRHDPAPRYPLRMHSHIMRDRGGRRPRRTVEFRAHRSRLEVQRDLVRAALQVLEDPHRGADRRVARERDLGGRQEDLRIVCGAGRICSAFVQKDGLGVVEFLGDALHLGLTESGACWDVDEAELVSGEELRGEDVERVVGKPLGHGCGSSKSAD